tara:strand:- start:2194 stop:3546 length:1353 start_codon:yes stop_codon:yes gene_type:complete
MMVNQLNKKDKPKSSVNSIKNIIKKKSVIVSLAIVLTGLGAALTGILFKSGIHVLDEWRLDLLKNFPAWFVLPMLGGIGGFISSTLITQLAPAASGSGVIQIIGFLKHKSVPMNLKIGIVKLFAGIIAIGSGFPLGPEGPSVQMGGSVAWQMARWLKAPVAFRRVIVAAGGGAGIAAVFSAPLGGFIYAIEELLNSARPVILLLVILTTFIADASADVLQAIGLDPNAGGFDMNLGFLIQKEYDLSISFLPIDFFYLIGLGIISGILAELYTQYVLKMQRIGNLLFKNKLILRMTIIGIFLGIIYSFLPSYFYHFGEIKKILTQEGISIDSAISTFIILFITTGLAAASGAPGGLFFPMLTLGGSIGVVASSLIEALAGHVPSTLVFAGMGGFVAGCSRAPITAMFLAFALTKDLLIMKPILICCIISFLIARIFNEESIYERQLNLESQ